MGSPDLYLFDSTLFSLTFWHILFTKTLEQVSQQCAGGIYSVLIRIFWVASDRNPSQTSWGKRRSVLVPRSLAQTCSQSCVSAPLFILASTSHLLDWLFPQSRRQPHNSHFPGSTPETLLDLFYWSLVQNAYKEFLWLTQPKKRFYPKTTICPERWHFQVKKKKKRQSNRHLPYAHCGIFPQILLSSTDKPVCLIDQGNFSSFVLLYYSLKVSSTPRLTPFTSGNFRRHLSLWESLVKTTCLLLT